MVDHTSTDVNQTLTAHNIQSTLLFKHGKLRRNWDRFKSPPTTQGLHSTYVIAQSNIKEIQLEFRTEIKISLEKNGLILIQLLKSSKNWH